MFVSKKYDVSFTPSHNANQPVGKRLEMFNYTGQNICTREVYERHMKEECNRVKSLKGKCLPWCVDPRPKDEVWMEDSVCKFPGAGGVKGRRLISAGIETVANLKELDYDQILTLQY